MRHAADITIKLSHKIEDLERRIKGGEADVGSLLKEIQKELNKVARATRPKGVKSGRHVMEKLTDLTVNKLNLPGAYADGGGLYLRISKTGGKFWVFRYTRKLGGDAAKAREMGLGPVHAVTLAEARRKAADVRRLLVEGVDPLEHAKAAKLATVQEKIQAAIEVQKQTFTVADAIDEYLRSKGQELSAGSREQWENSLAEYVTKVIGTRPVAEVNVHDVLGVFEAPADEGGTFWLAKSETAKRVRGRLEKILAWAATRGYRSGDNPARWDGHLENLLPTPSKTVRPMPALPFERMAVFMAELRKQKGMGAVALEFAILNAMRSGTVRDAEWSEIDFENRLWTVPAAHLKVKDQGDLRVPLSDRSVAILEQMKAKRRDDLVFPSSKENTPLSDMTLSKVIKTMNKHGGGWVDPKQGNAEVVPHGFRSSFKDWASEATEYPEIVVEKALAHAVSDKVEAAYRRGDLFDKRRTLMADWAAHCEGGAA